MGKSTTEPESTYRGVYRTAEDARKWEARLGQIRGRRRSIYLGTFCTAEDAARAYDIALIKLKGMAAITNFDLSTYDVKGIMDSVSLPSLQNATNKANARKGKAPKGKSSSSQDQLSPQEIPSQQLCNSSSFHSYQNPNLIPSNPYILDAMTDTEINDNSSWNYGAMFPNQGGSTVQQSLLLGTGQDFQAAQALQNNLYVNNGFHQNLLNNQVLMKQNHSRLNLVHGSQNPEIQNYLSFPNCPSDFGTQLLGAKMKSLSLNGESDLSSPNLPSDFGTQLLGAKMQSLSLNGESPMNHMVNQSVGAANVVGSFGLQSLVQPSFEAAKLQQPGLNQSYGSYNYHPNTLNQNPYQNLNSSCFSDSIQNPGYAPNPYSQSEMNEGQEDFDISQFLNMEENDFAGDADGWEAAMQVDH